MPFPMWMICRPCDYFSIWQWFREDSIWRGGHCLLYSDLWELRRFPFFIFHLPTAWFIFHYFPASQSLWPHDLLASVGHLPLTPQLLGCWCLSVPGPIAFKAWFAPIANPLHLYPWLLLKTYRKMSNHWKEVKISEVSLKTKSWQSRSPTVRAVPQPWDTGWLEKTPPGPLDRPEMKRIFRLDGCFRGSLIQLHLYMRKLRPWSHS